MGTRGLPRALNLVSIEMPQPAIALNTVIRARQRGPLSECTVSITSQVVETRDHIPHNSDIAQAIRSIYADRIAISHRLGATGHRQWTS
jgi:hypothetical protein